jgi:hypothetical protein
VRKVAILALVLAAISLVGVAAAASAKHKPNPKWTGTWKTNYGIMHLQQSGKNVTGTYTWKKGKVVGTTTNHVFTGTWSQKPTYQGSSDSGPFVFTMSSNGKKFTGLWAYLGQTPSQDWHGTRKSKK